MTIQPTSMARPGGGREHRWPTIQALAAAWDDGTPGHVAKGLTDILIQALPIEVVYVCLFAGDLPVEAAAASSGRLNPEATHRLGVALEHVRHEETRELPNPVGEGLLASAVTSIGENSLRGFVVTAGRRAGYPRESDLVVLNTAAAWAARAMERQPARTPGGARESEQPEVAEVREANRLLLEAGLRALGDLSEVQEANRALLESGFRAQDIATAATQSRTQFEALISGLAEGVVVLSPDGRIVLMNSAARNMLHIRAANTSDDGRAGGLTWLRNDGAALPPAEQPLRRALRGDRFSDQEVIAVPADASGSRRLLFSGSALVEAGGLVQLAIVTCRDVTALRELEQLREDYLALLSHDLRNPLTIVTLAAQRLARQSVAAGNEEMRESAELIVRNAERMDTMLGDSLHAAVLESGGMAVQLEPVSLVRLAESVARRYATDDGPNSQVKVVSEGHIDPVLADSTLIDRLLSNLVSNAFKYGGPAAATTIRIASAAGEVVVAVMDAGPGIAASDQPWVFDRFFRGHREEDAPKGLGLGLYIARLIVEAHGGRIWVQSEPGEGTAISFALAAGEMDDFE